MTENDDRDGKSHGSADHPRRLTRLSRNEQTARSIFLVLRTVRLTIGPYTSAELGCVKYIIALIPRQPRRETR